MRVLVYGINFYPELTGVGKYTGEMVQWLVENGCEVKVVTAPPYYPAWKVSDTYSGMVYRREKLFGVSVIRCPLWVPKMPTGLKRILHLASFACSSFPVVIWSALFWRPGLIFLTEPPLLCVPGLLVSAKLCRAKSWLHIQDFEVDAAFELGILKSPRSRRLVHSIEQWFMKKVDRVSTISNRMLDLLTEKGVSSERQLLFQNWVDLERIRPLEKSSQFRREIGVPDDVIVLLYSGGMGAKQGLELIVEAAARLQNREDLFFLLCGDGFVRGALEKSSQHIENIKFINLQPLNRLNELLNIADVHLLPQKPGAEDLVMPSKLTNMVASGRPVIAIAQQGTQVETIVRKCGIVIGSGELDAFVSAIEYLADHKEERLRLGEHGRTFAVENWEKEKVLSTVFADYILD